MKRSVLAASFALALAITGCAGMGDSTVPPADETIPVVQESASLPAEEQAEPDDTIVETQEGNRDQEENEMRMRIAETDVVVEWEDNQAVSDLMALAAGGPITVELSMYGGFEQVGPLGTSLTVDDEQITTQPGDIVLYAGNQISIFYGANSWAYTKLGHITDKTADEMADLLGNGDVSVTITVA